MKNIYLDNAASTQVDIKVFKAMKPYFLSKYGNASEPHNQGLIAEKGVSRARNIIADFIGCSDREIIFTSCSTESINLAHKGLIEALGKDKKVHVVTTPIEHSAVIESCKHSNAEITMLPVDKYGLVNTWDLGRAIKKNTILISIMYVNNEIGTIEPIPQIGKFIQNYNRTFKRKIYFHVDATQAIQYLDCNVDNLNVDLLSFTGHKIYAPKGIGVLYVRNLTPLVRQQDGGDQEFGLRAGTENVPYIVGLGKAVELIKDVKKQEIFKLRDRLIEKVLQIPDCQLTGDYPNLGRVPHIASFAFKGVRGGDIVLALSEKGITAASGSACTAESLEPSHVLKAIGLKDDYVNGSLRFSLNKYTTLKDISYTVKALKIIIKKLRKMNE